MIAVYLLQLRDHLYTLRFSLCFILLFCFFCYSGQVYTWKQIRFDLEEAQLVDDARSRYDAVGSVEQAVDATYKLIADLPRTTFMSDGGVSWFEDAIFLTPRTMAQPPGARVVFGFEVFTPAQNDRGHRFDGAELDADLDEAVHDPFTIVAFANELRR